MNAGIVGTRNWIANVVAGAAVILVGCSSERSAPSASAAPSSKVADRAPGAPPKPGAAPEAAKQPAPGARLTVTTRNAKTELACKRADTVLQLGSAGATVEEKVLAGACEGACTEAEVAEGARQRAEIERAIKSGEASESESDYSFTACQFTGVRPGRVDRIGDKDVALLVEHFVGPHDVASIRYKLALEVCGQVFVSQAFGEHPTIALKLGELAIATEGSNVLVNATSQDRTGPVYRLTLPACPSAPTEQVLDV